MSQCSFGVATSISLEEAPRQLAMDKQLCFGVYG